MTMHLCSACGTPVPGERCPHCDVPENRPGSSKIVTASAVVLLGLSMAACTGPGGAVALYGVEVTVSDNDGYFDGDDCDDNDADIHPGAEETAGDGVDSNCDGEDDPQT